MHTRRAIVKFNEVIHVECFKQPWHIINAQ